MKDFINFKLGIIKDFKGEQRLITACILSDTVEQGMTASWDDNYKIPIMRALRAGVAVYNPADDFNIGVGKEHAYQNALKSMPFMFITQGSIINEAITNILLDKIIENANREPHKVFPNYAQNAKKYKEIKKSEEFIDSGDTVVETIVQMITDGVDVKKIVDKATPYLNALNNDSSLVD